MGIVYRAFDPVTNREVTVKTIRDPQDRAVLELFKRECAVLASMTHPNIVEIFDIGETDEGGAKRPYFVMPLLPGVTLQELIRTASPRLTVERSVQMIAQICRGLWAAHEQGLVHRDLKPSNLFILPDDSVKIIDFGMAHLANHQSATGMKGTIPYMAPEQLQMKQQPTPQSDQFSLAVVCYEMLSRRHPFSGTGYEDVQQAILHYKPPPVSEFNPLINPVVSQVIHKALAKDPFHRFPDIPKFSDSLQRAFRGEAIDIFDPSKIGPRLQQARKALDSGDLDDAAEIVTELDAENYLTPEIGELRKQIEGLLRAKTVKQLLETARRRFDEREYVRALQKIQEILNIDPDNTDAFTLKGAIESKRSATQIEDWLRLATQHLENHAYTHARQALENALNLQPKEIRAQKLLAEVEKREQEHSRVRKEKDQVYQSAIAAYERGDLDSAAKKLERFRDLDRRSPHSTSPDQEAACQSLYDEVRSKRDQLASQEREARRELDAQNFRVAASICEAVLATYPNNVVFRALRDDIQQAERLEISAYVAKIEREVATEPDLNRKVGILEEAQKKYPSEQRFEQSLQAVRTRRDTVDLIAGRARTLEEQRQFSDALDQWETLRNIHPKYPGLDIEIDRLIKRREQQSRADAKGHWVTQVDEAMAVHNHPKAASLAADALAEFPDDAELIALDKQVQQAQQRALEAEEKANQGKQLHESGDSKAALDKLRGAFQLDAHNPMVRSGLIDVLLREASRSVDTDWRAAEPFVQEALDLNPNNPLAKSIGTLISDKRQSEEVSTALSKARELRDQGDIKGAFAEVDAARDKYPRDPRLIQYRASLREGLSEKDREELRLRDLQELNRLVKESKETKDVQALESIFQKSHAFSKYGSDADFREPLSTIEERLRTEQNARKSHAAAAGAGGSSPVEAVSAPREPGPEHPPSKPKTLARWKTLLHDVKPTAIWTGVGFGLVIVTLAVVMWPPSPKPRTDVPPLKFVTVSVQGATPDEYRIKDSGGTEVTSSSLPAGSYTLVASRPGFQEFRQTFTVDPTKGAKTVVLVQWHIPPTELTLRLRRSVGKIKLDGADQTIPDDGEFKQPWTNGPHSILWESSAGDSVDVRFTVSNAGPTIQNPVAFHGQVVGIIAILYKGQLNYQSINCSGGITAIVDGQSTSNPSAGSFPVAAAQDVTFKVRPSGFPLGDYKADPLAPPEIYVYLAPQAHSTRAKSVAAGETRQDNGAKPALGDSQIPAAPTEEEIKAKKAEDRKQLEEEKRKRLENLTKKSSTAKQ